MSEQTKSSGQMRCQKSIAPYAGSFKQSLEFWLDIAAQKQLRSQTLKLVKRVCHDWTKVKTKRIFRDYNLKLAVKCLLDGDQGSAALQSLFWLGVTQIPHIKAVPLAVAHRVHTAADAEFIQNSKLMQQTRVSLVREKFKSRQNAMDRATRKHPERKAALLHKLHLNDTLKIGVPDTPTLLYDHRSKMQQFINT